MSRGFFFARQSRSHNDGLIVTDKIWTRITDKKRSTSSKAAWLSRVKKEKLSERSSFETGVLVCMVKPKFGPFSRVGGDDRLIDKVNLR